MRKYLPLGFSLLVPFLIRCGGSDSVSGSFSADASIDANVSSANDANSSSNEASTDPDAGIDPRTLLPTRSAGCGMAASPSPTLGVTQTLTVDGTSRTYVLYVPKGYDPSRSYPIVMAFHGVQATGPEMADYIKMQDYSGGNAIVAFPSAIDGLWDINGDVDLKFVDAIIADISTSLCANAQRVFALGFSYGAYFANHLACNRSTTIRAFVAADGGFIGNAASCGRTAALVYHRLDDDNEAVANGMNARDQWLGINGCKTSTTDVTDWGLGGMGCVQYGGCPTTAGSVMWCEDTDTDQPDYKHDLRDVYRVPMWNWFDSFK